jgi:hypothetical protein
VPTYLVMAPNLSINAEVDAPDSRHARTTFLDYLSRNHLIPYTQRRTVRSVLVTKRVPAGQVPTTVQLSYYAGQGTPMIAEEVPTPELQQMNTPEESSVAPSGEPTEQPQEARTGFEESAVFKMSRSFGR